MINLDERVEKAKRLFKEEGYNCCQAVVLAYNDIFGIDDNTAAALSSGFGGGMGRMREVCGSVSGMVMLAGLITPAADPSIKVDRTRNYALVQEVSTDGGSGLLVLLVRSQTVFVHGVQDSSVNGLQTVTDVRQSTANDLSKIEIE